MTQDQSATDESTTSGTSRRSVLRSGALIAGAGVVGLPAFTGSVAATGCAFTPGYWKNHPEAWRPTYEEKGYHPNIIFGTGSSNGSQKHYYFDFEGYTGDNPSCMEILWMKPKGDKTIIMAHHFIAAILNIRNETQSWCIRGDDRPSWMTGVQYNEETDYIQLAKEFFDEHPVGSGARKWDGYEYVKDKLVDYNEGRLCVCGD